MTKKFWLIALIVACTVVFGSCDKSEELSVEQCKLDTTVPLKWTNRSLN